jgi:hypothetical protein
LGKERVNVQSELIIKENGKPCVKLSKIGNGTVNPRSEERFDYKKQNMFISEFKIKNKEHPRKFVVSIRIDGNQKDEGKCKLTQMNFDESELLELRNQIDGLLKIKNESYIG